jgi:hypothetical protein
MSEVREQRQALSRIRRSGSHRPPAKASQLSRLQTHLPCQPNSTSSGIEYGSHVHEAIASISVLLGPDRATALEAFSSPAVDGDVIICAVVPAGVETFLSSA